MNEIEYLLEVEKISKSFDRPEGGKLMVLKDVSLSINGPTVVALMGPNGSGKTTLIRIIAGEIDPSSGKVRLSGEDVTARAQYLRTRRIGWVHQESHKSLASELTVREIMAIASKRQGHLGIKFPASTEAKETIAAISRGATAFIEDVESVQTRHLSGGQRQLLALIVAVLGNPSLLLLDEHRASLDEKFKNVADEIVLGYVTKSKALAVAATHDEDWVRHSTSKIAYLADGILKIRDRAK